MHRKGTENMYDAEINSNTDIQHTCNGNVLEPTELLTDSESSSESVNSDSEAASSKRSHHVFNPNQKIIKHYMKMPHANWRILSEDFELIRKN